MMRLKISLRPGLAVSLALLGASFCAAAHANPHLLFELKTGKVIDDEEAFRRWHPASLTKLMTAYVTFRAVADGELALDSPIRVSKHAAAEPPSKMGFKAGSVMSLDNALKMMLVKSANDIAMAIGENVGGSEEAFVKRMNAEAARLGMIDTHFVNPNGLHAEDQYTTARDLAVLVSAIRTEFPQYAPYFSIQGLKIGKKTLMSYNMLIGRYEGADGMKTGYICPSGYNMIGAATRGDRTLVAVVLGGLSAIDRTDQVAALLDRGFGTDDTTGQAVSTMSFYGLHGASVADMRATVCGKKAAATQSEDAEAGGGDTAKSPWLEKIPNPKLVKVGLGGATGPIPAAMRGRDDNDYSDVPIPTPRPDYPPAAKTAQGDTAN
jgi:D-alanyl-D-alanine carboxypeptidase